MARVGRVGRRVAGRRRRIGGIGRIDGQGRRSGFGSLTPRGLLPSTFGLERTDDGAPAPAIGPDPAPERRLSPVPGTLEERYAHQRIENSSPDAQTHHVASPGCEDRPAEPPVGCLGRALGRLRRWSIAHPPVPVLAGRLDNGGHVALKDVALLREAIGDLRHFRQVVGTAGVALLN